MTLDRIIKEYISGDARRIIIPGIGAFIKRGGGELVFMDMLSADDGVLTGEVSRVRGITPHEAAAEIEKYAASLRSGLGKGGMVIIEGLGTLSSGGDSSTDNGINGGELVFIPETGGTEQAAAEPVRHEDRKPTAKPAADKKPRRVSDEKSKPATGKKAAGTAGDKVAAPAKDMPGAGYAAHHPENSAYVPKIHIQQRTKKRRRMDIVMIIAILALLAGIAAVVYGLLTKHGIGDIELF